MDQQQEFTRLYKVYGQGIKKLCLGYTGDAVLAQDLLQETFIAVWNHMQHFRGESRWSTWIFRIAVNTCLSHLRKNKDRTLDLENNAFNLEAEGINNNEQEMQLLYKCISQLPETDRLIIALVLEEKPYEEISSIIGITEVNLRVKIHRIKKQLTQIFNSYEKL